MRDRYPRVLFETASVKLCPRFCVHRTNRFHDFAYGKNFIRNIHRNVRSRDPFVLYPRSWPNCGKFEEFMARHAEENNDDLQDIKTVNVFYQVAGKLLTLDQSVNPFTPKSYQHQFPLQPRQKHYIAQYEELKFL